VADPPSTAFDPAIASRILNNERLRVAHGWGEYHNLGDALVVTADAPIARLNCVTGFHARERSLDATLDIGFALLRAFDREPAVELTPLDRPATIRRHLQRRRLAPSARQQWLTFNDARVAAALNPQVQVKAADADDARTFTDILAGGTRWLRRLALSTTLTAMHERGNAFYLAMVEGVAVGCAHLLSTESSAGIYALATLRAYRRRGVATALLARAVKDARGAGCEVIALSTAAESPAERLFRALGFTPAFETELWSASADSAGYR